MSNFSEEVEATGHLIDSRIISRIFEKIINLQGDFQIQEIDIGKMKTNKSYIRLLITGKDENHLRTILKEIYREGAITRIRKEIRIELAPKDCVMPDNFYSTTNNHTELYHGDKWIDVENMMMDKCIRIKDNVASCIPVRDVKKGDEIVVGDDGIKITPPELPRDKGGNIFEFMGSSGSSERPTQHIAKKVADDIYDIKKDGGKVIIVGGPAIVHTGASDTVAELIRLGFIDGVLAGNALAVHDIEYATLGTSLGMNVHDATLMHHGHRNHMDTVNAVFKAGSIAEMVDSQVLKKGIMYECVKNNIPFVLAGSIRDDGPLPDVTTDVVEAQKKYKKVLKGANMVLMISTMLHSIATGNMLPANVKVVAVDINQPTVTKLVDRGTWQALGVVTDVGAFLPMVAQSIRKRKANDDI